MTSHLEGEGSSFPSIKVLSSSGEEAWRGGVEKEREVIENERGGGNWTREFRIARMRGTCRGRK